MDNHWIKFFSIVLLTLAIQLGCKAPKIIDIPIKQSSNKKVDFLPGIHFLVIGDWGRHGQRHQQEVADAMGKWSDLYSHDMVVSVGDNFYPDGVISSHDPQWDVSFEKVYSRHGLYIPWYTIFGNHDYRGSVAAQLDYSNVSRRWRTKERYYALEKDIPGSKDRLLMLFLDTNPFDPTLNRSTHTDLVQQDTLKQKAWMDSVLKNSKAKWKVVFGHHPFYTTGVRIGRPAHVKQSLEPYFDKNNVDLYIAGHEHDLQHQVPPAKITQHIVCGAGSEVRAVTKDNLMTKYAASVPGFMAVRVAKDSIHFRMVDERMDILYENYIIKN